MNLWWQFSHSIYLVKSLEDHSVKCCCTPPFSGDFPGCALGFTWGGWCVGKRISRSSFPSISRLATCFFSCCESAGACERMIEKRDKGYQTILGIHFTGQCGTIWYFFHFGIHFLLKFDKILLQHNEKGNFMKKILLLYPVFVGVCGDKPVIFLYSSFFLYSRSYFCRNSFVKWNFFVIF